MFEGVAVIFKLSNLQIVKSSNYQIFIINIRFIQIIENGFLLFFH